jgi:hypothetical protein
MLNWSEISWATIITAIIAVYGAVLSTINLLAQRSRDRSALNEGRRRQAEGVTGWLTAYDGPEEPGRLIYGLLLQNESTQPVYELIASIVTVYGAGPKSGEDRIGDVFYRSMFLNLPPGKTRSQIDNPGQGMYIRHGVEIAFRDSIGYRWVRQGDGLLREVGKDPRALYGLPEPLPWKHADGSFVMAGSTTPTKKA